MTTNNSNNRENINPSTTESVASEPSSAGAFLNLIINIVIPVFILNKLSQKLGPLNALILAIAFPLFYGLLDLIKKKKWNAFSLLGLINVSITGGFAVLGLGGIWFQIKEAIFPLLIGVFVFISAYSKKPFIETIFLNPQLLKLDLIYQSLKTKNTEAAFKNHLKQCTLLLGGSFVISSLLNFILSSIIFVPLADNISAEQKSILLNEQIAKMTTWSTVVIMVPSMIILGFILWYLISGIQKMTGLTTNDILKN